MVERMNRTLGSLLKVFGSENQDNWDEILPICALAYNASRHASTHYSPNFLMFGRDFRVPLELVLPTPEEENPDYIERNPLDHYVKRLGQTMKYVFARTRENLQRSVVIQKHHYDKKSVIENLQWVTQCGCITPGEKLEGVPN